MTATAASEKNPWIETPLIRSSRLSELASCNVFLKLENLQPSGSFKSRALGNYLLAALRRRQSQSVGAGSPAAESPIHFYTSSGGNAGLGCVHAAVTLDHPATVVVPLSTTQFMVEKIRAAGAFDVIQTGESWAEADKHLREVVMPAAAGSAETPVYVPPFDAQDIWDGNATMLPEILMQLQEVEMHYHTTKQRTNGAIANHTLPDAVICSVGGGGLLNGICQGIDAAGLSSEVKVLAMETLGADSLSQAIKRKALVTLPGITSIATSLGARTVSSKSLEYGLRDMVTSHVVSDAAAVEGCRRLSEDHRLLVEPACGVCLVPIYERSLSQLVPDLRPESNVVVVVCGGSNVSMEILADYIRRYPYESA